jgi:beta-1,4-mannosyl-glycoprotein beta-1,4-N-acetylglucosaminyltransferase
MRIYDCFTFFNELDLLEMRLKILDPFVDYFVLVEATKTHAGKQKPLYFNENKNRFKKWEKKIIHIIVNDMPNPGKIYFKKFWRFSSALGLGRWKPEIYQRNQILRGLRNCQNEDIIIVSDLDEIPNPKKFNELVRYSKENKVILFSQNLYYCFLNGFAYSGWEGSRACNFKLFKKLFKNKGDKLRRLRSLRLRLKIKLLKRENSPVRIIKEGGWHFSYLGNIDFILEKISNFCHTENYKLSHLKDPKEILKKIDNGEDIFGRGMKITYVPIDSSFPEEIFKNKKKYSKFIR